MKNILFLGDFIILVFITLYGGVMHGSIDENLFGLGITGFSWLGAWLLLTPFINTYEEEVYKNYRKLWMPFWVMILASPIAGFIRGVILGVNVIPLFVVVFGGMASLGILLWRSLCLYLIRRRSSE